MTFLTFPVRVLIWGLILIGVSFGITHFKKGAGYEEPTTNPNNFSALLFVLFGWLLTISAVIFWCRGLR